MQGIFDPYISHIRFPHFKNLAPDLKVDFDFPVTALVGPNGTNKSSILRAIQGSPGYGNLGDYWFSTSTDPIADTGTRNAFIYGYYHKGAGKVVEVLKTRVKKDEDPDYWEPSRAITSYNMAKFDASAQEQEPHSVGYDQQARRVPRLQTHHRRIRSLLLLWE